MRLRNVPGSRDRIAANSHVIKNPEEIRGSWAGYFGDGLPIHLEIGMGKGRFVMDMARLHPEIHYIGIEMYSSVLVRALEKIDEDPLENVHFIRMNAEYICQAFGPGEVEKIYLNFSDPWPKERHTKRRLTSRQFLERYENILSDNGSLAFKTDNQDLFAFSLEEIKDKGWVLEKSTFDLHHSQYLAGNVMTEYEEKFAGQGKPICMLEAHPASPGPKDRGHKEQAGSVSRPTKTSGSESKTNTPPKKNNISCLAAIDLDGTLLNKESILSDYTKDVLGQARDNQVLFIPCSGRCYRSIFRLVEDIPGIDYIIGSNGCTVTRVKNEEILYSCKIPRDTMYRLYQLLREHGAFIELYSDNDSYVEKDRIQVIYDSPFPDAISDSLLATAIPMLSADLLLRTGVMTVNKIHAAFADPAQMQAFEQLLQKEFDDIMVAHPSYYNMEIFPLGVNKDEGIRIIAKREGISGDHIIAIGDSQNDLSMIRYAAVGVAVENGMDVLKTEADYITESNNDDGPAKFLEEVYAGKLDHLLSDKS